MQIKLKETNHIYFKKGEFSGSMNNIRISILQITIINMLLEAMWLGISALELFYVFLLVVPRLTVLFLNSNKLDETDEIFVTKGYMHNTEMSMPHMHYSFHKNATS